MATAKTAARSPLLRVRATIHLRGLALGAVVLVDPNDPYIAGCLKSGYLVPAEEEK